MFSTPVRVALPSPPPPYYGLASKEKEVHLPTSVRHGLGRPYVPWAGPPMGLGWAGIVRNEWALDGLNFEIA